MCYFEPEGTCEVYVVTHPRARKERECIVCCGTIGKGEQYERHNMVFEGSASTEWMCVGCAVAYLAFREDPHHRGSPSPSGFAEALRECFHGANRGDPDAQLWRDLYAGVLRRGLAREFVRQTLNSKRERQARLAEGPRA
jgi:hypothetical protein